MKKLTALFYCAPVLLFSHLTCAMTPDNTAAVIRKNAQNATPHPSISVAKNEPHIMTPDNNNRIIIPAGKTLIMPENDTRNIITQVVNYNGIQESHRIAKVSDTFILE
ncbi:TPA: hypothetical protein G9F27_002176 [Salmonella enterica]|uniref:Uncharacterized protein n=1 Tax=Salmonella enterica TaxID=28901 RepID=A0A743PEH0_SALER|nr:hypothetical protein [Salmonella enterica]